MSPAQSGARENADSCTMVIFGASGDLAKRKLIPALYNLSVEHRLPTGFSLLGYGRSKISDEEFRRKMRDAVKEFSCPGVENEPGWGSFAHPTS